MKNHQKNTLIGSHRATKIVFMICMSLVFLVFFAHFLSADTWDNLIAYYGFDEGAGNLVGNDYTGVTDEGSLEQGATWETNGIYGTAVMLDGTNDYVNVSNFTVGYFHYHDNFTISLWLNLTDGGVGEKVIMSRAAGGLNNAWWWIRNSGGANNTLFQIVSVWTTSRIIITTGAGSLNSTGTWQHVVITYDGTNISTGFKIYYNGISQSLTVGADTLNSDLTSDANLLFGAENTSTGALNPNFAAYKGEQDEIAIWSRNLSSAEVTTLYNGGTGTFYVPTGASTPTVTLNSPKNYYNTSSNSIMLNCSATVIEDKIDNITLYIDGAVNYTLTDGVDNFTEIYIQRNVGMGNYNWSCSAWSNSTIQGNSTTRYFNIKPYIINNLTYNGDTIQGNSETFTMNLSYYNSFSSINVNFTWNNTIYSVSSSMIGNETIFSKTLTIPYMPTKVNITFYFTLTLTNSSGTFLYNSSFNNQSVSVIALDDCSVYTYLILNYTLKDEETQKLINATKINSTLGAYNASIELDINLYSSDGRTSVLNYSRNYSYVNNAKVCSQSNFSTTSTLKLYAQAKYFGDTYVTENYYIQNYTLNGLTIPQHINLFDIKTADATEFLITYKDSSFLAVADALINIQRKYVGEGAFKSVEIEKTDTYGQTRGYFDTAGVTYTIIVSKEGTILSTFNNIAIFCEDRVIGKCNINLYESTTTTSPTNFYQKNDVHYRISFNQTTRVITAMFSTVDGSSQTFLLNVTKLDAYQNETVCTNTVTTSSGTLTCTVGATYVNTTVIAQLYKGTTLLDTEIYWITQKAREIFGDNLVVYILILVLSLVLMFIPSIIGVIIGLILGVIGSVLIFHISGTIIGSASLVIWIVIAGIIIIWKVQQRGIE